MVAPRSLASSRASEHPLRGQVNDYGKRRRPIRQSPRPSIPPNPVGDQPLQHAYRPWHQPCLAAAAGHRISWMQAEFSSRSVKQPWHLRICCQDCQDRRPAPLAPVCKLRRLAKRPRLALGRGRYPISPQTFELNLK